MIAGIPKHNIHTLTRSASDNGFECTSFPRIWATKSITGSGSMKAIDDISEWIKHNWIKKHQWQRKTKDWNLLVIVGGSLTNVKWQSHLSRPYTLVEAPPRFKATTQLLRFSYIRRIKKPPNWHVTKNAHETIRNMKNYHNQWYKSNQHTTFKEQPQMHLWAASSLNTISKTVRASCGLSTCFPLRRSRSWYMLTWVANLITTLNSLSLLQNN